MPGDSLGSISICAVARTGRAVKTAIIKSPIRRIFIERESPRSSRRLPTKGSVLYTVSGQGPWSHWHAISTSLDPASLQAGEQNLSPAGTEHRHGRCAHLACSSVFIRVLLFQLFLFFFAKVRVAMAAARYSHCCINLRRLTCSGLSSASSFRVMNHRRSRIFPGCFGAAVKPGEYQYQSLGFGILIRINHVAKSLNRSFATRCRACPRPRTTR